MIGDHQLKEPDQMWARRFDDPGARRLAFGAGATINLLTD